MYALPWKKELSPGFPRRFFISNDHFGIVTTPSNYWLYPFVHSVDLFGIVIHTESLDPFHQRAVLIDVHGASMEHPWTDKYDITSM